MSRQDKRRDAGKKKSNSAGKKAGKSSPAGAGSSLTENDSVLEQAFAHFRAGESEQSKVLTEQALAADPENPAAIQLLGMLTLKEGKIDAAIELLGRGTTLMPSSPEAHFNLACALHNKGDLVKAVASYEMALTLQPTFELAWNNLAAAMAGLGQNEKIPETFQRFLTQAPDYKEGYLKLGRVCQDIGAPEDAKVVYETALQRFADFPAARYALGSTFQQMGDLDQALGNYAQALRLDPKFADAHYNMGTVLQIQNRLPDAIKSYEAAVQVRPDFVEARQNLSSARMADGDKSGAINTLVQGLFLNPATPRLRASLAALLRQVPLESTGENERALIADLTADPNLAPEDLAVTAFNLIKSSAPFGKLASHGNDDKNLLEAEAAAVAEFAVDRLALATMARMIIADPEIEAVLGRLRRHFLLSDTEPQDELFTLLCHIAQTAYAGEYVWAQSDAETARIDELQAELEAALAQKDFHPASRQTNLLKLALYRPINALTGWEELVSTGPTDWAEAIRPLILDQVADTKLERELAKTLPSIAAIDDETSRRVQALYEENPYPRWRAIARPRAISLRAFATLLLMRDQFIDMPTPPKVLVAGCGTGRHPIHTASRFPDAEILAVDLSRASLAYASRMAEEMEIKNITFKQGDLLSLGELGEKFSVIESVGVLHHMADPAVGMQVLADLLEPEGIMRIGLYSRTARKSVLEAQNFVRSGGFPPTAEGIRACRQAITALPEDNPVHSVVSHLDFYAASPCRDLLMHVQETNYDLPEIGNMLDRLGLQFAAFERDDRRTTLFSEMFPKGITRDLDLWAKFEERYSDAFIGLYDFWCVKKEAILPIEPPSPLPGETAPGGPPKSPLIH